MVGRSGAGYIGLCAIFVAGCGWGILRYFPVRAGEPVIVRNHGEPAKIRPRTELSALLCNVAMVGFTAFWGFELTRSSLAMARSRRRAA